MLGQASLSALEKLVGLALDESLQPEPAAWVKGQMSHVFRAAEGKMPKPCKCMKEAERAEQARRRRPVTRPGW